LGGFIAGLLGYHLWYGVTFFNFYGKREVLPIASGFGLEFFGTFIQLLAVEYCSHRKVENGAQIGRVGVLSHSCAENTLFCAKFVLCKLGFRKTQHRGNLH
jgi:hypothetical protein